ncbi:MAG: hypothetical protein A3A33_00200 [Candidatus Yanofskybacteria bacterium RIFCSPLOWO2_01_FULL_49_25]|uniref:Addiction module toxin RelE n=1 Tax=Candidatus Yanofskybacteria bacterium RIFCSPLOWO2_01_FULL_49_25 TaxID=1802701 RepID=A0A1F8GUG5_9BACT|nr:MAG: hypothetical protein A3A33_00200 [Candidatus Yanofskybacteria bacterium RIFCSPLOWO2_01_FULL_49_25]
MIKLFIHSEVIEDIKLCHKKWYQTLGREMPRIRRLLVIDGKMPGEGPIHHIKRSELINKIFHARINLPNENIGKLKGPRIVYIRGELGTLKIVYIGGHKDKRYDDAHYLVEMIEARFDSGRFIDYGEDIDLDGI